MNIPLFFAMIFGFLILVVIPIMFCIYVFINTECSKLLILIGTISYVIFWAYNVYSKYGFNLSSTFVFLIITSLSLAFFAVILGAIRNPYISNENEDIYIPKHNRSKHDTFQ
jgi:hypothetical protein